MTKRPPRILSVIREWAKTHAMFSVDDLPLPKEQGHKHCSFLYHRGELERVRRGKLGRYGWPCIYRKRNNFENS